MPRRFDEIRSEMQRIYGTPAQFSVLMRENEQRGWHTKEQVEEAIRVYEEEWETARDGPMIGNDTADMVAGEVRITSYVWKIRPDEVRHDVWDGDCKIAQNCDAKSALEFAARALALRVHNTN